MAGSKKRSRRASGAKGEAEPAAEASSAPPADATKLEEFLISCQKSLARSMKSAQQHAKSDSEFGQGERPLYVIDALDIDLSAGVTSTPAGVMLDFEAPALERSRIRLRVETRPVDLVAGAKIELADLDPLGKQAPEARLRAWLIDPAGSPMPGYPVQIFCARPGERRVKAPIDAQTDGVGRLDFFVDTKENELWVVGGGRKKHKVYLRGSGRDRVADEYFVWVTCKRHESWKVLAPPPAPHPPNIEMPAEDKLPEHLYSELIRMRLPKTP